MSTLSIVNLDQISADYRWNKCRYKYRSDCDDYLLWPLGAGLWPVPVTFALLVGIIHCQRIQRLGKDISKTVAVIKAMVSSTEVTKHEIFPLKFFHEIFPCIAHNICRTV